ncbi:MAG: DoxX family protein [Flavobacteriaceae bacterium]
MSFLKLNFIPLNKDLGLLLVRIVLGATMIYFHGWDKLMNFDTKFHTFPDVIGIGNEASYLLVTYFETFGSLFIILGLYGRLHALGMTIIMFVGFFIANRMHLNGNGELALVYGVGFLLVLLNGAGKYSIDRKTGVRS